MGTLLLLCIQHSVQLRSSLQRVTAGCGCQVLELFRYGGLCQLVGKARDGRAEPEGAAKVGGGPQLSLSGGGGGGGWGECWGGC